MADVVNQREDPAQHSQVLDEKVQRLHAADPAEEVLREEVGHSGDEILLIVSVNCR